MEVNRQIVSEAIHLISERQLGEPEPELAHPLVTDQILAEHLTSIGHHPAKADSNNSPRSISDRVSDRANTLAKVEAVERRLMRLEADTR